MSSDPDGAMHPVYGVPNPVPPKGRGGNSDKYTPAGVVFHGGGQFLCTCGGIAWAGWDGQITSHTNPYYEQLEHKVIFPEGVGA